MTMESDNTTYIPKLLADPTLEETNNGGGSQSSSRSSSQARGAGSRPLPKQSSSSNEVNLNPPGFLNLGLGGSTQLGGSASLATSFQSFTGTSNNTANLGLMSSGLGGSGTAASKGESVYDKKNLYVSGLPLSMTEDELKGLFSQFGTIESLKLMLNLNTGESRGAGFICFETEKEAAVAYGEMEKKKIDDNHELTVRFAYKKARAFDGAPTKKIFIRNVPNSVTDDEIREVLARWTIEELFVREDSYVPPSDRHGDRLNEEPTKVAHLILDSCEAAQEAADALHQTKPWTACRAPLLAKIVDTGLEAKKGAKKEAAARKKLGRSPQGNTPMSPGSGRTLSSSLHSNMGTSVGTSAQSSGASNGSYGTYVGGTGGVAPPVFGGGIAGGFVPVPMVPSPNTMFLKPTAPMQGTTVLPTPVPVPSPSSGSKDRAGEEQKRKETNTAPPPINGGTVPMTMVPMMQPMMYVPTAGASAGGGVMMAPVAGAGGMAPAVPMMQPVQMGGQMQPVMPVSSGGVAWVPAMQPVAQAGMMMVPPPQQQGSGGPKRE